jgi:hypothetical protein
MTIPGPNEDASQEPSSAITQPSSEPFVPTATATMPSPSVGKPVDLALAALLVGVGAFLFGLIPVFGAFVGIAAAVLGILALRKQQSKGMALTGIILGGVAVLVSAGATIGLVGAVHNASSNQPAAVAESFSPTPETPTTPDPVVTPDPPSASPAPLETQAPPPPAPAVPAEYLSALTKAGDYSDTMFMSKAGIYDQLIATYGEQFTPLAAQ